VSVTFGAAGVVANVVLVEDGTVLTTTLPPHGPTYFGATLYCVDKLILSEASFALVTDLSKGIPGFSPLPGEVSRGTLSISQRATLLGANLQDPDLSSGKNRLQRIFPNAGTDIIGGR